MTQSGSGHPSGWRTKPGQAVIAVALAAVSLAIVATGILVSMPQGSAARTSDARAASDVALATIPGSPGWTSDPWTANPPDVASPYDSTVPSESPRTSSAPTPVAIKTRPAPPTLDPDASPSYPTVPPPDRTISGTITDLSGRPLDGIRVFVTGGPGNYVYMTTTDQAGRYQEAVRGGSYRLDVSDDSGTYADGFYSTSGFTYSAAGASLIDTGASNAGSVDLAVPPAIRAVITVTDANGSPIKGLHCYLTIGVQYAATTNEQGVCSFVVRPGWFDLWFQDPLGRYPEGYLTASGYSLDPYSALEQFNVNADSPDFHIAVSVPNPK